MALGKGEKKGFREARIAELGRGRRVDLVPLALLTLRPPPQPLLALAWELLSVSFGVVSGDSGLGPERFWAAWGDFLGLAKAVGLAKGLGSPGPRAS